MTRWMLERRMPPLKMLSVSPMLQIACPGRGCSSRTRAETITMSTSPKFERVRLDGVHHVP